MVGKICEKGRSWAGGERERELWKERVGSWQSEKLWDLYQGLYTPKMKCWVRHWRWGERCWSGGAAWRRKKLSVRPAERLRRSEVSKWVAGRRPHAHRRRSTRLLILVATVSDASAYTGATQSSADERLADLIAPSSDTHTHSTRWWLANAQLYDTIRYHSTQDI